MSAAESLDGAPRLVDLLLAEQRTLRAVDEFSTWHASRDSASARFETLIPGALPGEGQQFAFAVDLDSCTGCKACVTACHSLNGLEVGETWRKVGEIESQYASFDTPPHRQTVTTACHHCEDPACLAGCPVRAYDKDPVTGIVIHLDDQCIGCRYCQLMCPYDVPQFSERLGIVRKCDMCHGRLAAGEAPACVQGCPNEAISIEIVDLAVPREALLLPMLPGGLPPSSLTRPTTRYRTQRAPATLLRSVEGFEAQPAEPHLPLAVMLVLTQAAIGTLFFDLVLAKAFPASTGLEVRWIALLAAALMGFAGLGSSVFHLGRPQWAFRAFLGLGTSWMSREIVVFGGFAAALAAALCTSAAGLLDAAGWGGWVGVFAGLDGAARTSALATGLAGLFCSVKIYAVTGRPLWRFDRTALRFGATTVLLGLAVAAFARTLDGRAAGAELALPLALALALGLVSSLKLRGERGLLIHGDPGHDDAALERTRALFGRPLAPASRMRRSLGLVCGVALPLAVVGLPLAGDVSLVRSAVLFFCVLGCLVGEIVERDLFFRGEAMRGMPGPSGSAVEIRRAA